MGLAFSKPARESEQRLPVVRRDDVHDAIMQIAMPDDDAEAQRCAVEEADAQTARRLATFVELFGEAQLEACRTAVTVTSDGGDVLSCAELHAALQSLGIAKLSRVEVAALAEQTDGDADATNFLGFLEVFALAKAALANAVGRADVVLVAVEEERCPEQEEQEEEDHIRHQRQGLRHGLGRLRHRLGRLRHGLGRLRHGLRRLRHGLWRLRHGFRQG